MGIYEEIKKYKDVSNDEIGFANMKTNRKLNGDIIEGFMVVGEVKATVNEIRAFVISLVNTIKETTPQAGLIEIYTDIMLTHIIKNEENEND